MSWDGGCGRREGREVAQAGEGGRESRLEGDRLQSHEQGSGGE